jgi:2-methylcitrate dehydratase PrpD
LAEELAGFVADLRYEDLPPAVVEHLQLHTLDLIGVCLLGARMPFADMLHATVTQQGGHAESSIIARGGERLPAPLAAFFLGGVAHGNEFDDTYAPGRWHASAATLPALLATAEALAIDGKTFVAALAAALEVGCRLTRAAPGLLGRGFHSTATTGALVSALGCGKLLGFGADRLADALGIAGCFASGTTEFLSDPEAWPKRIQVGYAAQGAVLAARAAANGFKGPRTILEGRHGYFHAHAGEGQYDLAGVLPGLGREWEILKIYPKRYACDHIAQGYLDCATALGREHRLRSEDIDRVEVIVHPLAKTVMFEPHALRYTPPNGWSARWSMPFNMAVALVDYRVGVDSYSDERARDASTRALMERVVPREDASLPFPRHYPAALRVIVRDGSALERRQMHVAGSPENPMAAEEYEAKFLDNARRSLHAGMAEALRVRVRDLPGADMRDIAVLYAGREDA